MPNKTLPDIEILKEAKYFLSNQAGNPFFLAVGFQKPHIPFKYPKKYLSIVQYYHYVIIIIRFLIKEIILNEFCRISSFAKI